LLQKYWIMFFLLGKCLRLILNGEYAYIDPDPNTKKSTILSDGGKSIAYIDDFEGTKKTIPIGVSYTAMERFKSSGFTCS
jgi:hypothetical protein